MKDTLEGTRMATYAIGDIQGCLTPLQELLDRIQFDPSADRLWFVGDLVNRGPHSLEVLRFIKGLEGRCVVVLGNHDLHLLAVQCGIARLRKQDTLQPVLEAPDVEELMDWLRFQSMLHREGDYLLVHAGILPQWSVEQAVGLAGEVEAALRSEQYQTLLPFIYRSEETHWSDSIPSPARLGAITNVLTRMRMCSQEGLIDLAFKGPPDQALRRSYPMVSADSPHPTNRNGDLRALVRLGGLRRRRSDCVGRRVRLGTRVGLSSTGRQETVYDRVSLRRPVAAW